MTYENLSYALVTLKRKLILLSSVLIFGFMGSFPFMGRVINHIKQTILPEGASVIYLSPAEVILLKLKMALMVGVLLAIPVTTYYVYSALKARIDLHNMSERTIAISRFSILLIVIIAIALFLLGAGYAYLLMLPLFIQYLYQNAASSGVIATYSIAQFISFVALTSVVFGLVFEFPLIIVLAVRTRIVKRDTLVRYRYYVYIGLLLLAAFITPPDVFSQIIIAAPLIVFYEISLLLVRFLGRPKK